jgi:nucleoside-diphosphate-sugar epimerase
MGPEMNRLLIVGCGFVGNELVRQHLRTNQSSGVPSPVYALTRTAARASELRAAGALPIIGHWQDASTLDALPQVDTILVSVPHREDSGFGIESHVAGLKYLVQRLPTFRKLIYLSTTGVYGDAHDEVDELTPTQATRIGPQIAVNAENWLAAHFQAPQLAIIRLAGIYGPGRVPLVEKLRSGEALQVPQEGWLNLIHVADIAAMLLQVMQRDLAQSLYVFSDGQPVPRMDFYRALSKLCGVDEPRFAVPDPNASRSQRAGKKRVNPQRLITELNLQLQFPSYKEGLADCI